MLAFLCNNSSLFLMFGEDNLSLGIITAVCVLGDCIELIRTDHFIRLNKLGHRQTKRHLRA